MDEAVKKFAWELFQENTVMHGNRMIDKRTGESLDPEDDCTHKF